MPRVPVEQNRVGIAEVTDAKFRPADLSGTGLQAIGGGLQDFGQAGARFGAERDATQDHYDDAAVKQAWNTYSERSREVLRTGETAFYKQDGFNAGNALKPTQDALTKVRDESRALLKSPKQQELYDRAISERYGVDVAGIHDYADRQFKVEQGRQSVGVQVNSANDALDNAADPVMFNEYVATGTKAIEAQAQAQGWSPDALKAEKATYVSGIHLRVADQKMLSDPVAAAAYVRDHADTMTPGDRAKLDKALYEPLVERSAAAIVDGYPGAVAGVVQTPASPPAGAGSTPGRMVEITLHSESRNRDYGKDGKLLTSSAGARGRMQVMPLTQRDPGFGVRPAANDTPDELARVGRDYLGAMMKRYGNDPAKAWAAYNAGPGAVDNATKGAGNWLAKMPAETRAYVAKNVAMLGGDATPTYSPRRDDLNGLYQYIEAQNLPYDVKKAALAEADRRVSRNDRLLARQEDDAKDAAFEVIEGLGTGFTSITQLPAEVRRNLSPQARMALASQAEQNAAPKAIDSNGDAIINLHQQANLDPAKFMSTDLRLYRAQMSPAEFDQISTLQSSMQAKPNSAAEASHSAIWRTINFYGRDIGIDMGAKNKGESDEAFQSRRKDGMALFTVVQNTLRTITEGKRAPTDDEMKKAFDNAIIPRAMKDGTVAPRYRDAALPTNSVAVPAADFARIQQQLRSRGLPSDAQSVSRFYIVNRR